MGDYWDFFRGQTLLARWLEVTHQVIAQLVDAVSDTLKCGEGRSDRHSSEGVKMLLCLHDSVHSVLRLRSIVP